MNRFCSMFSQLLKLFPRTEFQALAKRTYTERHARGFTCWGQFVAMLFCQLGRAHSLREICDGLTSCEGKLSHLGITVPSGSTLAYANAGRPWQPYRADVSTHREEVAPHRSEPHGPFDQPEENMAWMIERPIANNEDIERRDRSQGLFSCGD